MNSLSSLQRKILKANVGNMFFSFSNADRKQWIMPRKNMAVAMNLYQPSSLKGKSVKFFLSRFQNLGFIRRQIGVVQQQYKLYPEFENLLFRLFQTKEFEFAVFCGTPSVHQKITIQISTDIKIMGYCKVSDQAEIKELFQHEQLILNELKQKKVNQIPECLYYGPLKDDLYVFVQTTTKTIQSKTIHQLKKLHWDFLLHLYNKTKQNLPFEQTIFSNTLSGLESMINLFSPVDAAVINSAIIDLRNVFEGKDVLFSAYHADFTPWNMFVENKQMFVFDWEYAQLSCPPFMDAFHFFTQTAIFEKKMSTNEILNKYENVKYEFKPYIDNPDLVYQCYLLAVIAQYTQRDKGIFDENVKNMIQTWIQLLKSFQ